VAATVRRTMSREMSIATGTRSDADPPPPFQRRPVGIVVIAAVVALVAAFLLGLFTGRDPSTHRYTYTGTVAAVCSHPTGSIPPCFAIKPDPGTANGDGYYAGAGEVSFGSPPSDGAPPRVGDHVTVTVVTVVNAGSAVTQVLPAADS